MTFKLILQTTLRGGLWGLLAGSLLSMGYGATFANLLLLGGLITQPLSNFKLGDIPTLIFAILLLALIGAIMGGIFGIPTGAVVGLMNGLLLGIITRIFFFPLRDARQHRIVMAVVSGLFTAIASWIGFILTWQLYANDKKDTLGAGIVLVIVPAIIAGMVAIFLSRLGTRWYEKWSINN